MASKLCVHEKRIILILLNFGDSWAHAADVEKGEGYAWVMSYPLEAQVLDFSVPSSSVPSMILQLQTFLEYNYDPNANYRALFFITAQERQLTFDKNGKPVELHPNHDGEYYAKYYNNRQGNFNLNTAVIALQSMCRRYQIDDHYLLGWQLTPLWKEVDTTKFYDQGRSSAINMFNGPKTSLQELIDTKSDCLIENNWHPSKQGHFVIAEKWLDWINYTQSIA